MYISLVSWLELILNPKITSFRLSDFTFFNVVIREWISRPGQELDDLLSVRAMRVGHFFSQRILTSQCAVYSQPWRYPEGIWAWSWGAGSKWPSLRRKVGTNYLCRSIPTSTFIVFLWTSNCISHLSYSGLTLLLKGWILPQKIHILDSAHKTSHCLMSQCILLQTNSELTILNLCVVSENLYAMYVNLSFFWLFSESLVQI